MIMNGAYVRPTYLTDGKVTLWNSSGPNKQQILYEQLESLGYNKIQINAHIHTLRNADMIKTILIKTDPTEIIKIIKETCTNAPILTEDVSVSITKTSVITELIEKYNDSDKFIARVLRGILEYPKVDHKQFSNEIDYLMACGEDIIKLEPMIKPIYPEACHAEKLFDVFHNSCKESMEKFLTAPRVIGISKYIENKSDDNLNAVGELDKLHEKNKIHDDIDALDCPILLTPMTNPTIVIPCGHTFEFLAIDQIYKQGKSCPICSGNIEVLKPNYVLKDVITQMKKGS